MRESNNDSSYMGSVSIENAPALAEKNAGEASIENVNDNKCNKGSVNKDGVIGKKGNTELSEDCFLGPDAAPSELLKDIVNINPSTILEPLLAVRKSCFKKMTVENNLRWQKKEISFPLLRMETEEDEEGSKQMFRNLLSYMGDRKSSKMPLLHARKYVKLVLIGNAILRDEAYIQVYKQLHNNPNHESNMRGWKMLAIISSVFVPKNKDIYNLILNYLFFEMQNKKDPQLLNHIRYIFVRMIRMKGKERHHVPCEEELGCIERLVPIELPVKFFTGNQTNVKIESYTTIRDLKCELMNKLDFNLQRAIYYSIYEICEKKSGTEERFIDDGEKVCDILSVWNSEMEKDKKEGDESKFHFYLRLLIYYPFEKDDVDTLSVVYHQTLYDVISGKHPVDERKIINLAAYQLVIEFQDDEDVAEKKINDSLNKFIPANKFNLMPAEDWKERIVDQYKKVNDIKKNDAKWEYIQELKSLPTYQMQQFNAKLNEQKSGTNEDEIPENCIIGLKPDGIMILDREHNEIVFYRYETIMNWGISKNQLIICISTSMNEIKRACFFTSQTKVIQALIEIYCNLLVGKTIKDIQDVVKNYDTKFEKIDSSRRKHSLMYKDEGGNAVGSEAGGDDVLGINKNTDDSERQASQDESVDN
ncbi:MAG: hypothetical protein J6W71_02855 [Methanobrevibacter sp.]|nr:hypothetical protein [Methanobrevibacter sp.]